MMDDLCDEEKKLLKKMIHEYEQIRLGRSALRWIGRLIVWLLGIATSVAVIYDAFWNHGGHIK